jgi:uncharacterized cupin superfamily protein
MSEPVERLNVFDGTGSAWEPFPEFDGSRAQMSAAPDGRVVAASYRLSGTHSWELPYDDYFYVIAGTATITIRGAETLDVAAGDFCHLRRGMYVTFAMSDDFHEISVLVSDDPFDVTDH